MVCSPQPTVPNFIYAITPNISGYLVTVRYNRGYSYLTKTFEAPTFSTRELFADIISWLKTEILTQLLEEEDAASER